MKNLKLAIIVCLLTSSYAFAQNDLVGETTKDELKNNEKFKWFDTNYNNFETTPDLIKKIKKLLRKNKYTVEIYFGTWCSDSQREVPRIIKILDESKFKFKRLKLIGVPRNKEVPNVSDEKRQDLDIKRVPTIIVYDKKGNEVNRYVEYAKESLEKDFIKILEKQDYKHSYY